MGERVFAQGHEVPDLFRGIRESKAVLEVALVLAKLLRELANAVAMLVDHPVVHRRLLERRKVLALKVLDDRDLERGVVVDLLDERRDRFKPGLPGRSPASLAGDELIAVLAE